MEHKKSKYKNFKIIIFKYTIFMKFNYFNVINKNIYNLKNNISLYININIIIDLIMKKFIILNTLQIFDIKIYRTISSDFCDN